MPLFLRLLPRRAFRRGIRAEYTTISGQGPEHLAARGALVEVQAGVGWHRLAPMVPAERTGDGRLEDHRFGPQNGPLDQSIHHHHLDVVPRLDRALLLREHDEAVRLRHRAQYPRALRAGEAHATLAVFQFKDPALVFG